MSGQRLLNLRASSFLLLSGLGLGCGDRGELVASAVTPPMATPPMTIPPMTTPPMTTPFNVEDVGRVKNGYGFALADAFFLTPCLKVQEHDCITVLEACPNQTAPLFEDRGRRFAEVFELGGDPLRRYDLTLTVNGIVEAKRYENGFRRSEGNPADVNQAKGTDTLYVGGTPTISDFNVLKISVFARGYDPLSHDVPLQYFYLNSLPASPAVESRATVPVGFSFTIAGIAGDSVVEFLTQDSNCRTVNNCGPGENGAACPAPRLVPNEPDLLLPIEYGGQKTAELDLIGRGSQPFHGQLVHVRLVRVQYSTP